jgi:hypothetical protein
MELFHTGNEIEKISAFGPFGEFLFFASEACHDGDTTYRLEVDDEEVIDAAHFFYREDCEKLGGLVAEVADLVGCEEDEAQEYLSQALSHSDPEIDWAIQTLTARAAKLLGFRGVAVPDEYGTSFMIDMLGHEGELTEV